MNNYVVWLDSKNAHIFNMKTTGIEKEVVSKDKIDHHTSHKKDKHKDNNEVHYFKELSKKLKEADQILLMGPGLAKNHFVSHLNSIRSKVLAKKIIGIENLESFEHETEKEMMAQVHKFFKSYDLFK